MKAFATLGTAVLFLSLGTIVPAVAQEGKEQAKPEQKQQQEHAQPQHAQQQPKQQQPQQHAQPQHAQQQPKQQQPQQHAQQQPKQEQPQQHAQQQPKQQQQHAQQQNQQKQQQQHAQQRNQPKQQQQHTQKQGVQQAARYTPQQRQEQQVAWQGHRSQNWQSDHRSWQQRGGYHGYRIPENRYNGYFGPNYSFVIYSQPYMVVGGFPRFQYNGFWFSLVDPWPDYWGNNWYENDNVYIVYENEGYYMYNNRYPGVGIAISVSM
jgi:hypothetical protein